MYLDRWNCSQLRGGTSWNFRRLFNQSLRRSTSWLKTYATRSFSILNTGHVTQKQAERKLEKKLVKNDPSLHPLGSRFRLCQSESFDFFLFSFFFLFFFYEAERIWAAFENLSAVSLSFPVVLQFITLGLKWLELRWSKRNHHCADPPLKGVRSVIFGWSRPTSLPVWWECLDPRWLREKNAYIHRRLDTTAR